MIRIERVYPSQRTLGADPRSRVRLLMDPPPPSRWQSAVLVVVVMAALLLAVAGCARQPPVCGATCGPRKPCGAGQRCQRGRCVRGQPATCAGPDIGADPPQDLRALWAAVSR